MNRAVCITTWREFKSNKVRVVMLFLLLVAPLFPYTLQRCQTPDSLSQDLLTPSGIALAYTLLWGVGVIGREMQHGTISLVLARPISIVSYVMSKWLAVAVAAAVCSFQAVLLEHLISSVFCPSLLWQPEFLANGLERILLCFGSAAFLILLSSLVSGLKDLALLAGICFLLTVSSWGASIVQYIPGGSGGKLAEQLGHICSIFGHGIIFVLYPNVPILYLIGGNYTDIQSLLSYATTITCCLALSIFVLTRKEFSYAAE
jgi:ABC-type transport system involved in multi-copper enzyme maturation permease subunit